MPRTPVCLALALLVAACGGAAKPQPIAAPTDPIPREHRVSCGPLAECAHKAAELCPGGYQLLDVGGSDWDQADESISRSSADRDQIRVRCSASERAL